MYVLPGNSDCGDFLFSEFAVFGLSYWIIYRLTGQVWENMGFKPQGKT